MKIKKIQSILLFIVTLLLSSLCSNKVLMVMSAADTLELNNGKKYQTGVFLNEFYLPYKAISMI